MMILSRLVFLLGLVLSSSQASTEPVITIPGEGEVVEGIVEIHGSIPADNFVSAKLAYAYSGENEQIIKVQVTCYEQIKLPMFSFLLIITGLYLYKNIRSFWKKL